MGAGGDQSSVNFLPWWRVRRVGSTKTYTLQGPRGGLRLPAVRCRTTHSTPRHAQGTLNESLGQAGASGDDEEPDQISFRTRVWMTVAILSSELLLAFNISMVGRYVRPTNRAWLARPFCA